jgi:hypothetical protein
MEYARNRRHYVLNKTQPTQTSRILAGCGAFLPMMARQELLAHDDHWRAGRPRGRSTSHSRRGRWDTARLLLSRANDSEHGNRPGPRQRESNVLVASAP